MKFIFAIALILTVSKVAFSGEIYVYDGNTSTIPINTDTGSIIELPRPIRVIGESKKFKINEIITNVDGDSRPVNVTIIKVEPRNKKGTQNEIVPVILTGKKSISLRFIAMAGADRHHKINFPSKKVNRAKFSGSSDSFLVTEIELMKQMINDEDGRGFVRTISNKKLFIEGYEKLAMTVVRIFKGQRLTGYTFKLTNTSEKRVVLNPKNLDLGAANRAVLLHIDHETLDPCSVNNSPVPKSTSCTTALRLVTRDENYVQPSSGWDLPFKVGVEP